MNNRVDIKNFILHVENNFLVNNWKINDIHLWPILRIKLFFYLINHVENQIKNPNLNSVNKTTFFQKVIKKVGKRIDRFTNYIYYLNWKNKLPQKEYLFIGADSHRVNYRNSRFNRYFDVLIEENHLESKSMYFENSNHNLYNKKYIYNYKKSLKGYYNFHRYKKEESIELEGYTDFLNFLSSRNIFQTFIKQNDKEELLSWFTHYFEFKISFFKEAFQKIKPKNIFILCYYSDDIYAMILAANKLGIKTIEMQHGPQTDIHLCYGSWSVVPKEGYDVLPRTFWCWDVYSKRVLEKWTSHSNLYNVEVVGNPWVNYWKHKKQDYFEKDFILYSLQPNPITFEQLFTPSLIQLIKDSKEKWFIRLHPRQVSELDNIKEKLNREGVLGNINLQNATNDPLPQLLANSKIHITHSSGSALEASYFGLKTILINEIGLKSFPHLIENNTAIFVDYQDPEFYCKIKKIIDDEK